MNWGAQGQVAARRSRRRRPPRTSRRGPAAPAAVNSRSLSRLGSQARAGPSRASKHHRQVRDAERADLDDGESSATVRMRRPGVAVLSASYDPGWTATVKSRQRPIRMVAPGLVAVDVPAGTDHVVFRFHGGRDYPAFLALSCLTLAMIAAAPVCVQCARCRRDAKEAPRAAEGRRDHQTDRG